MKYSPSDILDRLSILMLKRERGGADCDGEINDFMNALKDYEIDKKKWLKKLYLVNGKIWDLESDIRSGKEGLLGLEEVGRRALLVRDLNKKRIEIKNEIVKTVGIGHVEQKINHASA